MNCYRILYVEDNQTIRENTAEALRASNFIVEEAMDAETARYAFANAPFDIALIDICLPDGNGLTLLKELRKMRGGVSAIMVTALNEIDSRISGLDLGADDYITKPFSLRELIARIRAVLRRAPAKKLISGVEEIELNGGKVNFFQHQIQLDDGREIALTAREFFLFRYLLENAPRAVSQEEILSQVWQADPRKTDTRALSVVVSRLRQKLGELCEIETIYGFGYRLVTTETAGNQSGASSAVDKGNCRK